MDIRQLEGRSPEAKLLFAARHAESKGLKVEARRIRVIARALMKGAAADPDIALESWDEFHTWFDKNRSQGLEFTFEDVYGADSEEAQQVKVLLEGYDMLERRLHELYLLLKNEQPAMDVPEDTLEEPTEDVTEETIEDVAVEEDAPTDDEAAEALGDEGEGETEDLDESVTDEDQAAEEALAPEEEEESTEVTESSFVTSESKTIASLTKSLTKAKVKVEHIGFRGDGCYRIACAGNDYVPTASTFLKRAGMPFKTVEHPTGRVFIDVQMLPLV